MTRWLAALIALAVTLTACSGAKGSDGVNPVAWAERVCTSVADQAELLRQTPTTDPGDPAKAKQNLLDYLGNLEAGLDKLAAGVRDAGIPDVSEGTQVVEKVTKTLRDAKQGVELARTNLDKATVTDAASFQAAREKVAEDLGKLSDLEDPTKDLKANAELNYAFNKAGTCTKLDEGTPPSR